MFYFMKVIEIELSDETREVLVLEEDRKNCLTELIRILDHKGVSVRRPRNDLIIS
jgi:hypothetical protein